MNCVLKEDFEALAQKLHGRLGCFDGKKYFITGAAGFIGRYLTSFLDYLNREVLDRGVSAVLLDNLISGWPLEIKSKDRLQFKKGDVSSLADINDPLDYVIHAAGIASPKLYSKFPLETLECGTVGTRRMLELSLRSGCQSMLFFSSSEVYGNPHADHIPTKETYNGNVSIDGPRSCYDESKRMGETYCFLYAREFGAPVNIVRPFNVYGPGFRPSDGRVIPNFVERGLRGESLAVHGSGQYRRTFCYIADAIEAIFQVLFFSDHGEAYNIGNPDPEITIRRLAEIVASQLPSSVGVHYEEPQLAAYSRDNPLRRCPDISKLQKAVDFMPSYALEEGIDRTIRWYREEYGDCSLEATDVKIPEWRRESDALVR